MGGVPVAPPESLYSRDLKCNPLAASSVTVAHVTRRSVLRWKVAQLPHVMNKIRQENGTQTQTFGPDIFGWGGGLPRERVGAKKFDTSLETREIKLFGRDIPGFCRDIPESPEKFEKKRVCVQFPFPIRENLKDNN